MSRTIDPAKLIGERYVQTSSLGRSPWYYQSLATDTRTNETVLLKMLELGATPPSHLGGFQEWYGATLLGVTGILPVRSAHLQGGGLVVAEQPPEGTPWRNWMAERPDPGALIPRVAGLLERFADLHARGIVHNFILPENLWWHPQRGWLIADAGWLRWCFLNGFAPIDGGRPEQWTAATDGHQLGALIAHTLLGIELKANDLPLHPTAELKRRARKLPHPWPAVLTQLWGPSAASTESPMRLARQALDGVPLPNPSGAYESTPAVPLSPPRVSVDLPIAGSIASAAALSAAGAEREVRTAPPQVLAPDTERERVTRTLPAAATRQALRRENTKVARSFLIALLLLLAFSAGILWSLGQYMLQDTLKPTTVPDLVGLSFDAAQGEAKSHGFQIYRHQEAYSAEIPPDKIMSQSPAAGTTVKAMRDVYVTISRGARNITLPSLIGMTEEEVRQSLAKLDLKLGTIQESYTREASAGKVISQDPPANTRMAKLEAVNVVVSRGVLKNEVTMPDVIGQPVDRALSRLNAQKLIVRKIVRRYDYLTITPQIILQTPNPGVAVEQGTPVYLTVGAPQAHEPLGEFQIRVITDLPVFEGERFVKIVKRDGRGTATVYEKSHKGGDSIEILVDAYMSTLIEVWMDNDLIREEQY